jgi:type II secretory pathway pseudopilin PulG
MKREAGYTFIIVMAMVTIGSIGLLAAVPLWKTQIQRENEEELLFRGRQYVEAIRLYQTKNPGSFPKTIEELVKGRFLRKAFADPMTKSGKWDIILPLGESAAAVRPGQEAKKPGGSSGTGAARVFVVAEESLPTVGNPRIIGVVSRSTRTSFRIYNDAETYDTWFFFYGREPGSKPEIVRFAQPGK